MHDGKTMLFLERFDHGLRRGGSAHDHAAQAAHIVAFVFKQVEDAHPQSRHARSERHLLGLNQLREVARLHVRTGEDKVRSQHHRRKRRAPRQHVEHWDNRHEDVALGKPE